MHVFSAPKAWSLLLALLFAPCCWFIILLFLSFWNTGGHSLNVLRFNFREFKPKEKMRKRALQKKIFFSFLLGSFPLGCPETRRKTSTRVGRERWSLLDTFHRFYRVVSPTKSAPKRSHWEELDLVLFVLRLVLTRLSASSALHSRTPMSSCASVRFPKMCFLQFFCRMVGKKILGGLKLGIFRVFVVWMQFWVQSPQKIMKNLLLLSL